MLEQNRFALKEWAVTLDFLGAGRQIFLLRKGGIREYRGRFSVAHSEFFLFPTYTHQSASALTPAARLKLDATTDASDSVVLTFYSTVEEAIHVSRLDSLRSLDGHHNLNWSTVQSRFHYRNRPGLWVLVLRVYRQPVPLSLPRLARYDGCRSWVKLDREVSTAGLEAVLSEQGFQKQLRMLRCRLQTS